MVFNYVGGNAPRESQASNFSTVTRLVPGQAVEGSPGAAQVHAHGVQFDGLQEREKHILQSFVLLQLNEVLPTAHD